MCLPLKQRDSHKLLDRCLSGILTHLLWLWLPLTAVQNPEEQLSVLRQFPLHQVRAYSPSGALGPKPVSVRC